MIEEWKDIKGFEGKYQVSNTGKVRSLNYNNTGQIKELKQKVNRYGYYEVKLSKNNKTKDFLVSTLVGNHFIGEKNSDLKVMHIGDVKNNDISNLKFAYNSEIKFAMYKKGRRKIGKPTVYNISYKGKRYKRKSDIARDFSIAPRLLFHRIERGWTLEEALEIPTERKERILNKQLYNYNDKLMSIKDLSKISGFSEKTIRKRLARGWFVEEAVEIPLASTKNGRSK